MFIPIFSDLIKLRIRSNKFTKYLTIYLTLAALFYFYKSVALIYLLNSFFISFIAILVFPLTILLYPLLIVFTENYNEFFLNQILFFYFPLALRLISRKSKRRYF